MPTKAELLQQMQEISKQLESLPEEQPEPPTEQQQIDMRRRAEERLLKESEAQRIKFLVLFTLGAGGLVYLCDNVFFLQRYSGIFWFVGALAILLDTIYIVDRFGYKEFNWYEILQKYWQAVTAFVCSIIIGFSIVVHGTVSNSDTAAGPRNNPAPAAPQRVEIVLVDSTGIGREANSTSAPGTQQTRPGKPAREQ